VLGVAGVSGGGLLATATVTIAVEESIVFRPSESRTQ
jgi:hypothetical protein